MPTLAQRQRAAAAAAASATATSKAAASSSASIQQRQNPKQPNNSPAIPKHPHPPPRRDSSAKAETSEESNFSDEDSDEDETAAAFEMDSQELWTQNYCATCDCLIEPGQGVGIKKEDAPMHSPTSSISRTSGLKSKSGTIKARPLSSDAPSSNANMKRTHSAGKLHAAGIAGPLGPHKRTGSAAGRLNALSELRPTTKLNGDSNKTKGTAETGQPKRSPGIVRRESGVSEHSAGVNSANSSRPTSPISPNHSLSARSKKNRAAPPQNEEDVDENKIHSTPALYCSERCQQIDEQRSSGLGELVYYLHQPVSPSASNWSANGNSNSYSWSSRNLTMANRNGNNVPGTPESECYCPECMDKNSASGTVPSGASDTTESSVGFPYGQGGRKQRTQSGRIMTPQGLIAPGGHGNDYFGMVGPNGQRKSVSKASQRGAHGLDTVSQTSSTEASALSSESAVSEMWEPQIRPTRQSTLRSPKTTRESQMSNTSDDAYGTATTGTVTPAATIGSPRRAESPFVWHGSQQASASPLRLLRQGDHHSYPSVDVTSEYARSPQPNASGFLSRSLASENTELAASSGFTVAGVTAMQHGISSQSSSLLERRRESSMTPLRMTNSPMPITETVRTTSAIGTLKNAQSRAMSEALSQANRDDRRQSTGGSSIASSTNSGWLRNSISSAWNTIRGLPASNSTSDATGVDTGSEDGQRRSSSAYDSDLQNLDAMTLMEDNGDPTPKQSQITRPKTTRGDIPAFASEIGHGSIPGEEEGSKRGIHSTQDDRLSKSFASAHGSIDEDRRRRRSEKERAQRHQRSKDVTVLPPLLGVSRASSGVNLQAYNKPSRPHHTHHSSTASLTGINNRNRAGSYGQQSLHSSSFSQINGLAQTPTPGLRPGHGANGRMTPSIELGSSPGRMMSVGSLGTSPRRGGLGWGAMTAIASPDATQTTFAPARPNSHASHRHRHHQSSGSSTRLHHQSSGSSNSSNKNLVVLGHVGQLGFHPHGHGPIYGRHATTPVRSTTPRVPEDGGEMSGAALKGEGQDEFEQMYSQSHTQRRSSMAPPPRPRSGMNMRRQSDLQPPSNIKRNSAGLSPLIQQSNLSSEDAPPVKMYPVLDIPNRQPTHDRYDTNWLLNGTEIQKETEQQARPAASKLHPPDNQASAHRKRLFYFDTT